MYLYFIGEALVKTFELNISSTIYIFYMKWHISLFTLITTYSFLYFIVEYENKVSDGLAHSNMHSWAVSLSRGLCPSFNAMCTYT